jgi:lipoprotein-releasing system permease protein
VTAVEDALADAAEAMRRANFSCADMLFEPFQVVSWSELNPDLFSLVNQERIITAIFVAMIVVVAGFIIISGLSMTVVQKKREIGIMRAMGARSASVATIFGLSGFVIGMLGTALGTVLGLLISENFNPIRNWVGAALGFKLFSPYPTIPISVQLTDLIVIWTFTLVWSVLVSIVPAISAARLDPAQALRWE